MSISLKTALIVLGFMVAGCGGEETPSTPAEPEDRDEVVDPMAESLSEPMEDAKAVEDQAMEHKEAIDEAVEDAEEPPAEPPAGE